MWLLPNVIVVIRLIRVTLTIPIVWILLRVWVCVLCPCVVVSRDLKMFIPWRVPGAGDIDGSSG